MLKLPIILVLLFVSLAFANLQCELCKMVIGAAELDITTDDNLKGKIGDKFLSGCNKITDQETKYGCQTIFSKENFPIFLSNFAKAVDLTPEQICEGMGSC